VQIFDAASTSFLIKNAGGARNKGLEGDLAYLVTSDLTLHGSASYADLKYTDYTGAPCYNGEPVSEGCIGGSQDLSGTRYGGPPLSANLGATYDRSVASDWNLGLTGDVYYNSHNPKRNKQPFSDPRAYGSLNASVRLYQPKGRWEFALIGANLTNAVHFYYAVGDKVFGITQPPNGRTGDITGIPNRGREITVQATAHF